MATIRVRDLMTEPVYWISPEAHLLEVRDLMTEKQIRHVPVVDTNHNVIGVVSHRDLLRSAMAPTGEMPVTTQAEIMRQTKVGDIMTRDVDMVDLNENVSTAALMMLASKHGCLPVVDGTRLTGIVTEADFVRYLVERAR